jgi:Na+-driven multidrug efflux pump
MILGSFPSFLGIILILVFGFFWKIIGICIALAINSWVSLGFYYLLTLRIRKSNEEKK